MSSASHVTAGAESAVKSGPGPLTARPVDFDPLQHRVQSDFSRPGIWDDIYVSFHGYFGAHGPQVFAAAPELLQALRDLVARCEFDGIPNDSLPIVEAARAAIAKATEATAFFEIDDGPACSLAGFLAANADDEAACSWARSAKPGDRFAALVSCVCVEGSAS